MRLLYLFLWLYLLGPLGLSAGPPKTLRVHTLAYTQLESCARTWGLETQVLPGANKKLKAILTETQGGKKQKWVFNENNREASCEGVKLYLGFSAIVRFGQFYIAQTDVESKLQPLTQASKRSRRPGEPIRIVLDPGHGGKDKGTVVSGVTEKSLCLNLAKKLKTRLEAKGYRVFLTRTLDSTAISLEERARLAARHKADLFISLHINAAGTTTASGIETYAYTPSNEPSTSNAHVEPSDRKVHPAHHSGAHNTLLAHSLQKQLLITTGAQDRGGPRMGRFKVLRLLQSTAPGHMCPGALVELGFLTHPEEGAKLQTQAYQQRLVEGLVKGVENYVKGGFVLKGKGERRREKG